MRQLAIIDRLQATRRALIAGAALSALTWALGTSLILVAALAAADALIGLPLRARALVIPVSSVVGGLAFAVRAWRSRGVRDQVQVALWVESRVPSLGYALVTLADPTLPPSHALVAQAGDARWDGVTGRAIMRALLVPIAAVALGAVVLTLLPAAAISRVANPHPGDVLDGPLPGGPRSRLTPLAASVTPPAYTGRPRVNLEEPATIAGISGSAVTVDGRGDPVGLIATLGETVLSVEAAGRDRWRVSFVMPGAAMALQLSEPPASRLIVLAPYPDSLPVVTLTAPARDTILRAPPTGRLPLAVQIHDDLGLTSAFFELIVSSGELETFTSRATTVRGAGCEVRGKTDATCEAELPLDSLRLQSGDVMHMRAVATDGRDPFPGRGASETRTWRILRRGEYDSLSLEGAPPSEGDSSVVSQRMLIMLTEALERRRRSLDRTALVSAARGIARDQSRLRRRVADIIFMRLGDEPAGEEAEGENDAPLTPEEVLAAAESAASRDPGAATDFADDESPVVAVNRPLLEAYNAMWDAQRELDLAEPDDALPHMRAALAAIQRARAAERVYLRGRPPQVVVDIRRVRLAGNTAGAAPAGRGARSEERGARGALAARFERAVDLLLRGATAAAVDSLQLLRVDAIATEPAFAGALGDVARGVAAGTDVTDALLRARRVVTSVQAATAALPAWFAPW